MREMKGEKRKIEGEREGTGPLIPWKSPQLEGRGLQQWEEVQLQWLLPL